MSQDRDEGLEAAVQSFGGVASLAAALEISANAVYQWRRVPHLRVLSVERLTGVSRERLRPDLYPTDLRPADLHPNDRPDDERTAP